VSYLVKASCWFLSGDLILEGKNLGRIYIECLHYPIIEFAKSMIILWMDFTGTNLLACSLNRTYHLQYYAMKCFEAV